MEVHRDRVDPVFDIITDSLQKELTSLRDLPTFIIRDSVRGRAVQGGKSIVGRILISSSQ